MKGSSLTAITWTLVTFLFGASILLFWSQSDRTSNPSALSTGPSGTRAFADLLRDDGFAVQVDRSPEPELEGEPVVIAYDLQGGDIDFNDSGATVSSVQTHLLSFAKKGGTVLYLGLPSDFDEETRSAAGPQPVSNRFDASAGSFRISAGQLSDFTASSLAGSEAESVEVWRFPDDQPFVTIANAGKGVVVAVQDGVGTTNRFLTSGDNAKFFLELVRNLAPAGSRIVFADAALSGGEKPGVFAAIGPWANIARNQAVLLFFLGILILGMRFGLPDIAPVRERGTRELVDAMGDTMLRAKQAKLSLKILSSEADLQIRRKLKLPANALSRERDELIPPTLASSLFSADELCRQKARLDPAQALGAALRLEKELGEWKATNRGRRLL